MLELADIVRRAGPRYREVHAEALLPSHHRAMRDIAQCRTPALGGSLYQCDDCRALDYRYHSCRNRHCPKCQEERAQDWLRRTRERLLPCDHYLLTFTLPGALRSLARSNQKVLYAALIREAAATIQALAKDRRWVGGTPGILAVLHSWSRTLEYHPHVHLIVTAGGLSADGTAWIKPAHPRFLAPGYMLSVLFRAKMRAALERSGLDAGIDPTVWARAWARRWTVHVQQIGTGDHAVRYLARYVYRVALSNHALESFTGDRVTFRYTHACSHETKRLTLPVNVFLGRFLQHVLPRGFTKVRSYGLLSPRRRPDLDRARVLLQLHAAHTAQPADSAETTLPTDATQTGDVDIHTTAPRCAQCQCGNLRFVKRLRRSRAPP